MRRQTCSSASRAFALIAVIAAVVAGPERAVTASPAASGSVAAAAQERDRAKIPDRFKWNLTEVYASEAAWRTAKDKLAADLPQLRQFQGRLASSPATLADALDKLYAFDKELSRLGAYAGMLADQDTRDAAHQGMRQEMSQLASTFSAEAAFLEPELLRAGKATLDKFLAAEPRLKVYRFYVEDVARRAAHSPARGRSPARRQIPTASWPTPTFPTHRSRSATAAR